MLLCKHNVTNGHSANLWFWNKKLFISTNSFLLHLDSVKLNIIINVIWYPYNWISRFSCKHGMWMFDSLKFYANSVLNESCYNNVTSSWRRCHRQWTIFSGSCHLEWKQDRIWFRIVSLIRNKGKTIWFDSVVGPAVFWK